MPIGGPRKWSRRGVPLGLLGAMAMIAAVESHVERNAIDYQGGSHWSGRVSSSMARSGAKANQVLCFGDSLMKLGLAPRVIEAATGLKGYNFAQTGGQAPGSYFLLRRAIDSGAQPRAILVDFFPRLLKEDPSYNDENWPYLANLTDGLGLATVARDPDVLGRLAFRLAFPSARSRNSLRFKIQTTLEPCLVSIKHEILKSIRNWKVNRGAEITPSRPGLVENLDVWELGYFTDFRCSPVNLAYVEKFLDLAESRQIPVFWVLPPYQPQLQARCDRSGFSAAHEAFIRPFLSRYPHLAVLDARTAGYPAEVFYDLHHLGREGAAVLSSDVGQVIRRYSRASSSPNPWVTLPPYRPRPEIAPIENVEESRAVVWRETQAGRGKALLK